MVGEQKPDKPEGNSSHFCLFHSSDGAFLNRSTNTTDIWIEGGNMSINISRTRTTNIVKTTSKTPKGGKSPHLMTNQFKSAAVCNGDEAV